MRSVLIVEDSLMFRKKFLQLLSSRFSTVVFQDVGSRKEALEKIGSSPPALVFMDISLAQEDGLELTSRIKDLYPNIYVSVLTGHSGPEYRQAAYQNGADSFMVKGATKLEAIFALLQSVLFDGKG